MKYLFTFLLFALVTTATTAQCNADLKPYTTGFDSLKASSFSFLDTALTDFKIVGYDNLSWYYVDVYHNGRVRGMNFIDDELRAAPPPPTVEYNKKKTIKMSTSMRVSIWTFVALQVVFLYIALNT